MKNDILNYFDLNGKVAAITAGGGDLCGAMAEALGRKPPASRYSADLSLHPMIGEKVKEKDKKFLDFWKDEP